MKPLNRSMTYALTVISIVVAIAAVPMQGHNVVVGTVSEEPSDLGYTLTLDGSVFDTTLAILDGLAEKFSEGRRLAVLSQPGVSIGALQEILSMAAKVGYDPRDVKFLLVGQGSKSMLEVTIDTRWVKFSADPESLDSIFDH